MTVNQAGAGASQRDTAPRTASHDNQQVATKTCRSMNTERCRLMFKQRGRQHHDHDPAQRRRPLPPGPPLRQHRLARPLRHLAQHHRRPQRLRQRPSPRSPRPACPTPCSRHRRPVDLHRAAADSRQHPQDPRLAGPDRPRQDPHHPARTTAPFKPARLPPRRLTRTSTHASSLITSTRAVSHAQAGEQPRSRPAGAPRPGRTAISAGVRAPRHTKIGPPPQFCRYETGRNRTVDLLLTIPAAGLSMRPWPASRFS